MKFVQILFFVLGALVLALPGSAAAGVYDFSGFSVAVQWCENTVFPHFKSDGTLDLSPYVNYGIVFNPINENGEYGDFGPMQGSTSDGLTTKVLRDENGDPCLDNTTAFDPALAQRGSAGPLTFKFFNGSQRYQLSRLNMGNVVQISRVGSSPAPTPRTPPQPSRDILGTATFTYDEDERTTFTLTFLNNGLVEIEDCKSLIQQSVMPHWEESTAAQVGDCTFHLAVIDGLPQLALRVEGGWYIETDLECATIVEKKAFLDLWGCKHLFGYSNYSRPTFASVPTGPQTCVSKWDDNDNTYIDNPEMLDALDAWLRELLDDTCFLATADAWLNHDQVSAASVKRFTLTSFGGRPTFFAQGASELAVKLYDTSGREVFSGRSNSNKLSLNKSLANGVYLYVIKARVDGKIINSGVKRFRVMR